MHVNEIGNISNTTGSRLELSQWGLPDGVLNHYKKRGITHMFPWQVECLSLGAVLDGENLVYSAPTSAGKTLVAEILVTQAVYEKKKKALIILPFVSVVREKMFYFQEMFSESGIRVEGFMGGHTPSASFQQVQVGVCTIEKANSLINKMLEDKSLSSLGIIVVDELHLLGDPYRGYLLELLLTKLKYMLSIQDDLQLQIVGMSATLPNLNMLAKWLKAKLYYTDFRPVPLSEHLKCGRTILNSKLEKIAEIPSESGDDSEDVGHLCIETIKNSHSILIFCPTKVWCESLSVKIALLFRKLGCSKDAENEGTFGWILRQQLDLKKLNAVVDHLKISLVGLDKELAKTIPYGVAFHHAGLTLDERDIIEGSFKNGVLRVLCATSTLSSGVNLPARRVVIRSPMSFGGVMDIMTYRQMIGRAGRMGVDTEGESILICKPSEKPICQQLMLSGLKPITSCLGSGRLSASLKRAILEVVASGIVCTWDDIKRYAASTFLACSSRSDMEDPLTSCVSFLEENELIRLKDGISYAPTPLGQACLASSLPPDEGLALFRELERARRCFVLDSDLHIIYQITPYSVSEQWSKIDWFTMLNLVEELSPSMKRVAELVGIEDGFLVRVVKGTVNTLNPEQRSKLSIHRRFYTALALQDLVNEVPLAEVARKFDCNKGMLQSLQQSAATYAGMVAEFSRRLRWGTIELIVSHFQERLQFGVQRELCELMRLPSLNGVRARALFNAGFTSLPEVANCDLFALEAALLGATPFQSKGQGTEEPVNEAGAHKKLQTVWVTGRAGLSILDAAKILVKEARGVLEMEMGVGAKWDEKTGDQKEEKERKNDASFKTIKGKSADVANHAVSMSEDKLSFELSNNLQSEVTEDKKIKQERKNDILPQATEIGSSDVANLQEKIPESENIKIIQPFFDAKVIDAVPLFENKLSSEGREVSLLKKVNGDDIKQVPRVYKSEDVASGLSDNGTIKSDCSSVIKQHPILKTESSCNNLSNMDDLFFESCCDFGTSILKKEIGEKIPDMCSSGKGRIDEMEKGNKEKISVNYIATGLNVDLIETPVEEKKATPVVVRNRFSTDIFVVSPIPCSTPKEVGKSSASVDSPDLFSQSLTFDTQLEQIYDSEEQVPIFAEDIPSSPQKSDDLGYLSDSPIIVAEVSVAEKMLETVGESFFAKSVTASPGKKRKASPDVIVGSDDSASEDFVKSRRNKQAKSILFRSRSRRLNKRPRYDVTTLEESDEEIAPTPHMERTCSWRGTPSLRKKILDSVKQTRVPKEVKDIDDLEPKISTQLETGQSVAYNQNVAHDSLQDLDWQTLKIVDVCGHQEVFESFKEELKEKNIVGLAFGCRRKLKPPKPGIGAKFKKVSESKEAEELMKIEENNFGYGDIILEGVAIYWYKNSVFFMSSDGGVVSKEEKILILNELGRKSRTLRVFGVKEQLKVFKRCTGIYLNGSLEDPKVAGWLLSGSGVEEDLREMVGKMLEKAIPIADFLVPSTQSIALDTDSKIAAKTRACSEAFLSFHLVKEQATRLEQIGLLQVFSNVEMPTLHVLTEMELEGLKFDEAKLKTIKSQLESHVAELEIKAHALAGRRFALSSYVAVGKVLYTELRLGKNLPYSKKKPSTSKETLELLESETKHPLPRIILQWRKLKAIINKTLFPLLQQLPSTRVHGISHFTVTGRISMREPNLQNVPRDFDVVVDNEKRFPIRLRDMFVAPDGHVLLSADYCQIELRLLAHLSQDQALIDSINGSADVFVSIAAGIHGVADAQVTPEQRQRTKQTCYGIIYGIGPRSLAQQLQVLEVTAQSLIDDFKTKYSGVCEFLLRTVAECQKKGFIETLSGRRRYLPFINSDNLAARSEAERQAINTTVQGSAADLIKTAMVAIRRQSLENDDMKLVLHLHDEVIYQVKQTSLPSAAQLIKTCMENAWLLSVSFPVKVRSGPSWGQLYPL